jgi:hypothetical protein
MGWISWKEEACDMRIDRSHLPWRLGMIPTLGFVVVQQFNTSLERLRCYSKDLENADFTRDSGLWRG